MVKSGDQNLNVYRNELLDLSKISAIKWEQAKPIKGLIDHITLQG